MLRNQAARIRRGFLRLVMPLRIRMNRLRGLAFFPPNYLYLPVFTSNSIIIDVGCGSEAEFSRHVIERFNANAFGVDPTRKHEPFLTSLVSSSGGKFRHLPVAVTRETGVVNFHESKTNESGSALLDHVNVERDEIIVYPVRCLSLKDLILEVGVEFVDFVKLDLEGAEYDLLTAIRSQDVSCIGQLFVEFHHHCTSHTQDDTKRIVRYLTDFGFDAAALDDRNYLFVNRQAVLKAGM